MQGFAAFILSRRRIPDIFDFRNPLHWK